MTTTGRDHTRRLDTRPRRPSPPNWISNGLLRYALRAPLRSPLLQPRSCAKQPPGSNPSWGKAGGQVIDAGADLGRGDAVGLLLLLPFLAPLLLEALALHLAGRVEA